MIERIEKCLDDESFKFRALSAGAVMAFDGQTDLHSFPSILVQFVKRDLTRRTVLIS